MAVTELPIKYRYLGNGVTANFSFPNKIYDETDLVVEILVRTTSALVETLTLSDYSVAIAENGHATVTITNALKIPSATQDILLRAEFPKSQDKVFPPGTILPAEQIVEMGDKLTSIAQQLAEQTSRALTYNEQSPVTNATIANPVADATLAFDGTTGAIKAGASLGDISNAAANATAAAASAATASSAATAAQAANGGTGRVARLATAGNVTLSGLQTIDGVVGADGDRIFVRGQTTAAQNGIYIMASGAWTRATDANTWSSFVGMLCTITEGSARKNHVYISLVTQGGTLGTTPITFDTVPIDGHVGTIKIADNAVTPEKIAQSAAFTVLGNNTNATANKQDISKADLYPQSFQVGGTVAANALTATLQPTPITFRSATAGSGAINNRMVSTAVSLTIPSGATVGTSNGVESTLLFAAIDNAGTVELAVINTAFFNQFASEGILTTAAIAGGTAANQWYSQTARTNVPYKLIGTITSTQATAGTWATAPSRIQGFGIAQQGLTNIKPGIVQYYYTEYTTYTSSATTIPFDNTIPQITEGVEIMTLSITPTNANNRIAVQALCQINGDSSGRPCAAIFRDSVANALAVGMSGSNTSYIQNTSVIHDELAGGTNSRTYRVRVGESGGNIYVNGNNAGRFYGGAGKCTLVVFEYSP